MPLDNAAVTLLSTADLSLVDQLMKESSGTLGFLPSIVIEQFLKDGGVIGIRATDGRLAAYLMFAEYPDRIRIVQLCVAESFRGRGLARKLVQALKKRITSQTAFWVTCRNDYPADGLWPILDFVPVYEKVGKSKQGHLLTVWRLAVAKDPQLELRPQVDADVLDVVIDAQIFFDLCEPVSEISAPSHALQSDTFVGLINLFVTDELLSEIRRNDDLRYVTKIEGARASTDQSNMTHWHMSETSSC